MSLRTALTLAAASLILLMLLTIGSIFFLTFTLHRAVDELGQGLHSVQLAEELQVNLLTYDKAEDGILRARLQSDIRRRLREAEQFVGTPDERNVLEVADRAIRTYLSRGNSDVADLEEAFSSLERLTELNIEQARHVLAQTIRRDMFANVGGGVVTGIVLIGVAAIALWLRLYAFRSFLQINRAVQQFSGGDMNVRAEETGPAEFRDMARRFNDLASTLADRRERQLTFLAGVAHDLRNPIAALKLSMWNFNPEGPLPEEVRLRKTLSTVKRQVDRLDRMIGDLLDATQIEAGRLDLRMETHDLREIAYASHALFQTASPKHLIDLSISESPVLVRCDVVRLEQVLNNLLSNAVKYSPHGGDVRIAVQVKENAAIVEVSDQGVGIPPEEVKHLFEPFRRLGSNRDAAPGAGLGLSVSRKIIEAHQGTIEVESRPGEGSTFRITLPLAPRLD